MPCRPRIAPEPLPLGLHQRWLPASGPLPHLLMLATCGARAISFVLGCSARNLALGVCVSARCTTTNNNLGDTAVTTCPHTCAAGAVRDVQFRDVVRFMFHKKAFP